MVIGIVVSVIEKENAMEEAAHSTEPTMTELHAEIQSLKAMITKLANDESNKGQS